MKHLAILTWVLVALISTDNLGARDTAEAPRYRNIILMIGDGMGLAQISSARLQQGRLWVEEA